MYFEGDRLRWVQELQRERHWMAWFLDRCAFPWLAFVSAEQALAHGRTPLDMERFRAVWPLIHGRLLDIGCGDNLLVEAYRNGVGVDIVDWGFVDVVIGDAGQLPFDDQSFDTVTVLAALNHIPNRGELLRECHRVLTPRGRLVLTMLNPWVSFVTHHLRRPVDPDQTRHQHTEEVWGLWGSQVKHLLSFSGFKLDGSRSFVWGLNRVYWASVRPVSPSDDARVKSERRVSSSP